MIYKVIFKKLTVGNLQFSINVPIKPEKMMKFITDFEYYRNYFPAQIKEVKILDKRNNEVITEERIIFSTLIKNEIVQKSQHKLISNKELCTEIIDGPAKNTIINIICVENERGSEIKFNINLKLSLKAKFLAPFIKKLYKRYLTAIIYKIIDREASDN